MTTPKPTDFDSAQCEKCGKWVWTTHRESVRCFECATSEPEKRDAGCAPADGSVRKPGKLTLEQATILARSCEYAWEAVQTDNPINWADAGAFFLEGWEQGMRDAIRLIKAYKPKHKEVSPNEKLTDDGA